MNHARRFTPPAAVLVLALITAGCGASGSPSSARSASGAAMTTASP